MSFKSFLGGNISSDLGGHYSYSLELHFIDRCSILPTYSLGSSKNSTAAIYITIKKRYRIIKIYKRIIVC